MAYFPPTGSLVAYQSLPSSLLSGSSIFGQLPGGTAVLGSVAVLQGTLPWNIAGSVAATIQGTPNVNAAGSVVAFQGGTQITSVVSTIPSSVLVGASIFGQLPAGTAPLGSVAALQGTNPWITDFANSSILAGQTGTRVSSLVSTIPSSVIVGASIFGQLPAGTAPLGSVATLQGTNPWIETFSNSSILAVPVGSVIILNQGSSILAVPVGSVITVLQAPSIVGTYAEDAGHTTADKGLFTLGVRNDAVASFVSANLEYTPGAVDSAGRTVIKPFISEDGTIISYTGSVVSASVTLIQGSAIGLRNYITDFWVANTNTVTSVSTLITFQDGSTSIIGRTIAPAAGGSNSPGIAIPLKTNPSQDLAFTVNPAASIIYMTVKGYQAP